MNATTISPATGQLVREGVTVFYATINGAHTEGTVEQLEASLARASLRFFWNGIKVEKGKLQKCSYSDSQLNSYPKGTITIYAPGTCGRFSAEIATAFTVENETDSQSDYFAPDRIRVTPDHPLYAKVAEALAKRDAHYSAKRG